MKMTKNTWITALGFALMLSMPAIGFAQEFSNAPSAAEVANNATSTANSFFLLIQSVCVLVGFVLVVMGLYGFYKVSNKQNNGGQASIPLALTGCVIGVLMIMLPITIGTLGKSIFGDAAGRPKQIQLTPN